MLLNCCLCRVPSYLDCYYTVLPTCLSISGVNSNIRFSTEQLSLDILPYAAIEKLLKHLKNPLAATSRKFTLGQVPHIYTS